MTSKLFQISPHEAENQTEVSLREAFNLIEPQLRPPFPLTIPSPSEYSQLNRAIIYGILTEPHFAKVHFTHLNAIITDGYIFFVNLILKLVFESYHKLLEPVKVNLIWVTSKLVEVSAIGIDNLLVCLMRQIVGGDVTDGNLWLCKELLKIFLDKFEYLLEEPLVITSALFNYLRLLADHYRLSGNPKLEELKHLEIDFCVQILRKHFHLCLRIGRDLVRLLQDLVYIPEFRAIWNDLLLNPVEFRTLGFSDVSQLYCLRTSSRYFLLRISPEMETQLRFLLTHVKWGHQRRYQEWFARKFFCRPESEFVICDIVRFICCAHHPPNEIIQSDVISRWGIIGWLLKCCRKNHVEANTKLALFYDWLFFDERTDNIMNIEPGILLMVHSIPKYIDMTHTLLEFLFLLVDNYDVARKNLIIQGVSTAFRVLVKKGVVHSLEVVTSCSLLSPLLKERLAYIFSDSKSKYLEQKPAAGLPHCSVQPLNLPSPSDAESQKSLLTYVRTLKRPRKNLTLTTTVDASSVQPLNLPNPSHVESQKSLLTSVRTLKRPRKNVSLTATVDASFSVLDNPLASPSPPVITNRTPVSIIEELVQTLGENAKRSNKMGLQTLGEILFLFATLGSDSLDTAVAGDSVLHPEVLASRITKAFKSNGYEMFAPLRCPHESNCDEEIQSATAVIICTFIFSQQKRIQEMILFWSRNGYPVGPRLLCYASRLFHEARVMSCLRNSTDEESYIKISNSEMSLLKHHVDRYISFLRAEEKDSSDTGVSASKLDAKLVVDLVEGAFASYRSFLMLINLSHREEEASLSKLLFSDLLSCCGWETKILKSISCSIFSYLSDLCTSKEEFIRFLVEKLDHVDLLTLQFEICLKRFSIFGEDTKVISHLVKSSLDWGFLEQQKFWALMASELAVSKVQVEKVVMDCLVAFNPRVHSIATGGLFALCSRCRPSPELVGVMISLPDNTFGDFAAAILTNWVVSNGALLFNSIVECLEKLHNKDTDSVLSDSAGVRINNSTISELLHFLDKQETNSIDDVNEMSVSIPALKARLMDVVVVQSNR